MKAFKGFTKDIFSNMGDRKEENCQFYVGEKKQVQASKIGNTGFHCCEYPFACCHYYNWNDRGNRFFEVEASGDIQEEAGTRIACTEITLVKELSEKEFLLEGMKYMIRHPMRDDWKIQSLHLQVTDGCAVGVVPGDIAISRCENPKVQAAAGCWVGLIRERDGVIDAARMLQASEFATYFMDDEGQVKEVRNGDR